MEERRSHFTVQYRYRRKIGYSTPDHPWHWSEWVHQTDTVWAWNEGDAANHMIKKYDSYRHYYLEVLGVFPKGH